MAQWKSRGYVLDSDEEDDSSNKSESQQEDHPNIPEEISDHVVNTTTPSEHQSTDQSPTRADKEFSGGTATVDVRNEVSVLELDGLSNFHHQDTDELQEGHYQLPPKPLSRSVFISATDASQSSREASSPKLDPPSSPLTLPSLNSTNPSTSASSQLEVGSQPDARILERVEIPFRDLSTPQQHVQISNVANHDATRQTRNLRHRNPIQLHPYAIEGEQYRQKLKNRGIKPLRIAQSETQAARGSTDDPQADEFTINARSHESTFRVSSSPSDSIPAAQSVLASPSHDNFQGFSLEDGELPDMDAILRNLPPKIARNGHKRRRVMQSDPKRVQSIDPKSSHPEPLRTDDIVMIDSDQSCFDVPISPPRFNTLASLPSNYPARREFRFPKGVSPVGLPTTITSSESKRRPPVVSDARHSDEPICLSESSEAEYEVSSNESTTANYDRLAGVQRKIRGVLPASWLKLDLKAQAKSQKPKDRNRESHSPEKRNVRERGIARPVAPRYKGVKATGIDIEHLDSSDGAEFEKWRGSPPLLQPSPTDFPSIYHDTFSSEDEDLPLPSELWGEVAEDNCIDAMIPTAVKKVKTTKSSQRPRTKKRQRKLTSIHVQPQHITGQRPRNIPGSSRKHQSRLTEYCKTPRRPKFRPPDLSLLDIASPSKSSSGPVPSFMRIARRTVRSRHDEGRSGPARKYLRLATVSETKEANEYLRSWWEGTLKPKATGRYSTTPVARSLRNPLQPCAGNQRDGLDVKQRGRLVKESLISTIANPRRRAPKPPKSSSTQLSLDRIIHLGSRYQEPTDFQASRHVKRNSIGQQARSGFVRPGHFLSSLRDPDHPRPATLESLRANIDPKQLQPSFLPQSNSTIHEVHSNAAKNPLQARFLADDNISLDTAGQLKEAQAVGTGHGTLNRRRRPRKRKPQQVNIYSDRLPGSDSSESFEIGPLLQGNLADTIAETRASLIGLGPFGTAYTTTFNIAPLPTGTYFTVGTFLGSGKFAKSFIDGDLDQARGSFTIHSGHSTFRWGPWNDSISDQLGTLIDRTCESFQRSPHLDQEAFDSVIDCGTNLLEQVIHYFATTLSFYDSIDRVSFLQRCQDLISRLVQELSSSSCDPQIPREEALCSVPRPTSAIIRAFNFCTIIASQLCHISKHHVVPDAFRTESKVLLEQSACQTLKVAFGEQYGGFAQCRERLIQSNGNPVILDESHAAVESLVVVSHLLAEDSLANPLWNTLRNFFTWSSLEAPNDARELEMRWERLFLVLPFLEISRDGVLEVGRRYKNSMENWTSVKILLEPVFEACQSKTHRQASTLNDYCRALFGRCFRLINTWGWWKCESNIGVLFDFFARRGLFNLRNEEAHGSPLFLAQLHQQPSLEIAPEDRCFHIFLKIISTSLQTMREVYPVKKIGGIIWRLLPNHGRFLPKDQAISQFDLDALRNHHDLLCTLYWASPQGFRPKPTVIQNLVDVEGSHKEACRINIRAWSNLVKYQLTAKEPATSVEPFVSWSTDLLAQILRQHHHARSEAEEQVRLVEATEGYTVNKQLLESTIIQNQRQVEAVLSDALSSTRDAINVAPDLQAAKMLLLPSLILVFNLFNIRSPQTNKVIIYVLDILLVFIAKASPQPQVIISNDNDDSQDYGDWSAFGADMLPTVAAAPAVAGCLEKYFQDSLRQLLSNCFGADSSPEDAILTKVIETWVAMGKVLVHEGLRSWADYIGDYGNDSWASLRDTEQTRKYLPYYLAVLVDADRKVFQEHRPHLIKAWTASLVERESLLKYQHRLTSSLLNADSEDLVIANPPFWAIAGHFEITPAEFSERRLSLISNMLSNMRKAVDDAVGTEEINLKADYKAILRVMMSTMKSNYQALGQGSNLQGAYVDFVHRVIEFLQQHTSTICPIDRFFTDSSSFPLPANDPTYVVGQLKNYGLRLHDQRTPKQLAMFIQSVSERAAVDGQQMYLVDQLHTAMASSTVRSASNSPNLRTFLLTIIFPAYIDIALSTSCGWIIALPILQATKRVFSSIMTDIDGANMENVTSTSAMITGCLGHLQRSLNPLFCQPDMMKRPDTLKLIAAYFATITAALPALDYLCLVSGTHDPSSVLIDSFKSFVLFASQSLLEYTDIDTPDKATVEETAANPRHTDVQAFTLHELRETLYKNWIRHGEQYYINRGQSRREVVVDIGLFEEEKAGVIAEIERFFHVLERMSVLAEE
ncbi:MAG: hypothetical protein Q9182_003540 [Xanthomendoza sp. 2 TL-2023]